MAVDSAESDAASRLNEMGRKGIEEKRRPFVYPVLFFFLYIFAVNAFSQDLESLDRAIHSGNSEQKRTALYEIKKIGSEAASRIAIPALNDSDVMVRSTAASAVIYLPRDEATNALLPLLNDKQEFVRREAAYALGDLGSTKATTKLVERLEKDRILEVRTAAAVALGRIGDPFGLHALTAILRTRPKEDDEFLRRSAARSIGQVARRVQFGKTAVVTPQNFLATKYKDAAADLKDLTRDTQNLENRDDFTVALGVLISALDSPAESIDTRREAAFAAGLIGSGSAIPILTKYSSDSDPYLAEICKEALLKLQPQK